MAGQLRVNEITDEAGTGSPSFPNGLAGGIPAGTAMMFVQTAAPTGWTKSTAHDNKALRVVSGTASSGGSVAFTTAFASQAVSGSIGSTTASGTVGSTTLSLSQIPSHNHLSGQQFEFAGAYEDVTFSGRTGASGARNNARRSQTSSNGGGESHTHSFSGTAHTHSFTGTEINLAVQYVDVIIATKD